MGTENAKMSYSYKDVNITFRSNGVGDSDRNLILEYLGSWRLFLLSDTNDHNDYITVMALSQCWYLFSELEHIDNTKKE